MRTDLTFHSNGERLAAWHYPAESGALTTERGRPCVVMAHGFGGTRDSGLAPFAEAFADAGADVLLFDYRGFGDSGGEPRQVVDHRRHREDYHAAISTARDLPGVDPDRIVLWGSSYSGGHVVAVAAQDQRVCGVISQGAAMDGPRAVLNIASYAGLSQVLRLTGHALLDVARGVVRAEPHAVALVGPPGSLAAMTSADAEAGYLGIAGPTFRNEMRGRDILKILVNRPVRSARKLRMPLLLVVAEQDSVAPVSSVRAVARKSRGPVQVEDYDVGHFDIYTGAAFEKVVAAEVDFLRSVTT
jgi:pimeloyl-ACP methyl ester carboxylesterase